MSNYLRIGTSLQLKGNGAFYTTLNSSSALTSSPSFTLPPAYPTNNGVIESSSTGVLSSTPTPMLEALWCKDVGTAFKVAFTSPALGADTSYVFPSAKPVTYDGFLQSTTAGALSWNEYVSRTNVANNKLKTYAGGYYSIAGDDVPVLKPTVSITFATTGDNTFVADITLLCIDHVSTESTATLKYTATGGKLSGASGTNIVVGNIQSTGTAAAQWSTAITTTPSVITMEKDSNLAQGNYSVMLYVSILNGTVVKFRDVNGAVDLITFTY